MHLNITPDLPMVPGHFKSLERAVTMLLDNAIKFSPAGSDVRITIEDDDDYVKVSVSDQGVGIPENALPYIFDRFFHVEEIGDELFGGLGLGLSIARWVAEAHGGNLTVESQQGEGTTFTLWLQTHRESG